MRTVVKCPECGFKNWSDADTCKRCLATLTPSPADFGGFDPAHSQLDDMSYPSYSSYVPAVAGGAEVELAGRITRLVAAFIDTLLFTVPIIIVGFVAGAFDASSGRQATGVPVIGMGAVSLLLFYIFALVIAQIYLLMTQGQTLGKKMMSVRIVKQDTRANGGFSTNILLRWVVPVLISCVPLVGSIFGLIDSLFIFRQDRRCIHDLIAGTIVVKS